MLSTVCSTETDVISATASTSTTETQVISVTDTTLATVTQTATPSVAPAPVCSAVSGPFRAHATQYQDQDEDIFANANGATGSLNWNLLSDVGTNPILTNRYIWTINNGHLALAYTAAPYDYAVFVATSASSGSLVPRLGISSSVESQMAAGLPLAFVNACVDTATGELQLDAVGRTQILWCGGQVWLSNTLGSDIVGRGTCVQMFPTVVMV